jgi:tetratricopeptide (TPR) repeat protein
MSGPPTRRRATRRAGASGALCALLAWGALPGCRHAGSAEGGRVPAQRAAVAGATQAPAGADTLTGVTWIGVAVPDGATVPALLASLAAELDAHGHADAARTVLRRAVAWQRARPPEEQRDAGARYDLGRALYLLGDYAMAAPLFAELAAERPRDVRVVAHVALIAARRGHRAEAGRVAARLAAAERPYDRGQTAYARADRRATGRHRAGPRASRASAHTGITA